MSFKPLISPLLAGVTLLGCSWLPMAAQTADSFQSQIKQSNEMRSKKQFSDAYRQAGNAYLSAATPAQKSDALSLMAWILNDQNKRVEAARLLEEKLPEIPPDRQAGIRGNIAWLYLQGKQFPQAIERAEALLQDTTLPVQLRLNAACVSAEANRLAKQYPESQAAAEQALALQTNANQKNTALNQLLNTLADQKKYQEAEAAAVRYGDDLPDALRYPLLMRRCEFAMKSGRFEDAEKLAREVLPAEGIPPYLTSNAAFAIYESKANRKDYPAALDTALQYANDRKIAEWQRIRLVNAATNLLTGPWKDAPPEQLARLLTVAEQAELPAPAMANLYGSLSNFFRFIRKDLPEALKFAEKRLEYEKQPPFSRGNALVALYDLRYQIDRSTAQQELLEQAIALYEQNLEQLNGKPLEQGLIRHYLIGCLNRLPDLNAAKLRDYARQQISAQNLPVWQRVPAFDVLIRLELTGGDDTAAWELVQGKAALRTNPVEKMTDYLNFADQSVKDFPATAEKALAEAERMDNQPNFAGRIANLHKRLEAAQKQ